MSHWPIWPPMPMCPWPRPSYSACYRPKADWLVKAWGGFTLLEILVALFVFAVASTLLVSALHHIMAVESATAQRAGRLREAQMALLLLSRDVEQAVDRPIINAAGQEEASFIGTPHGFTLTRMGNNVVLGPKADVFIPPMQPMRRVRYYHDNGVLWRMTWPSLDQGSPSQPNHRPLLFMVSLAQFDYLDEKGHFQGRWPPPERKGNALPRAVRAHLTISQWGEIKQLYVLPTQIGKGPSTPG